MLNLTQWKLIHGVAQQYGETEKETGAALSRVLTPIVTEQPLEQWDRKVLHQFLDAAFQILNRMTDDWERGEGPVSEQAARDFLDAKLALLAMGGEAGPDAMLERARLAGLCARTLGHIGADPETNSECRTSCLEILQDANLKASHPEEWERLSRYADLISASVPMGQHLSASETPAAVMDTKESLSPPSSIEIDSDTGESPLEDSLSEDNPNMPTVEAFDDSPSDAGQYPNLNRVPSTPDFPEPIPEQHLATVVVELLKELRPLAERSGQELSDVTKDQIRGIPRDHVDPNWVSAPLFFAARNILDSFRRTGNDGSLDLARKLAHCLLAIPQKRRDRRVNAWRAYLGSVFPRLIPNYDILELLKQVTEVSKDHDVVIAEVELLSDVLSSFEGLCKSVERKAPDEVAGKVERETLVREYEIGLREIDRRFRAHAKHLPQHRVVEEEILFKGLVPNDSNSAGTSHGTNQPQNLFTDRVVMELIREGDRTMISEYIGNHRDEIETTLRRLLDVQLDLNHLMRPEGSISDTAGDRRGQMDPHFRQAVDLIDKERYGDAERVLRAHEFRWGDAGIIIAGNWLAYARAKNGEKILAKDHLRGLLSRRPTFSSIYWNLACCTDLENQGQRLEALSAGLENAPHPRLLHAGVCVALDTGNEDFLRKNLPCLTLPEAVLLNLYLEMDNDPDPLMVRLNLYAREAGEKLEIPEGLSRAKWDSFINTMIFRKHNEPIGFVLRVMEKTSRRKWQFWEIKTDYLYLSDKRRDALLSFREELRWKLAAMVQTSGPGYKLNAKVVQSRIEDMLNRCMSSEDLKEQGHAIYKMVNDHVNRYPQNKMLLPRAPRIRRFYEPPTPSVANHPSTRPDPEEFDGKSRTVGVTSGRSMPSTSAATLTEVNPKDLLSDKGEILSSILHGIDDVPSSRNHFDEVIQGLKRRSYERSAAALESLVTAWEKFSSISDMDEKTRCFEEAREFHIEFKSNLVTELPEDLWRASRRLQEVITRLLQRLPRDLELLPDLSVEGLPDGTACADGEAERSSFAVRVRAEWKGREVPEKNNFRILQASARLRDEVLPLLDKLSGDGIIATTVSSDHTAVLTFQTVRGQCTETPENVAIELAYKMEGTDREFRPSPFSVPIIHRLPTAFPEIKEGIQPYFYGRAIETEEELRKHFVGREAQRKRLLDAVEGGQKQWVYVEGLRRTGKSSLLYSLVQDIRDKGLPIIPVYLGSIKMSSLGHPCKLLSEYFNTIASSLAETGTGFRLDLPSEDECIANINRAYNIFLKNLDDVLPEGTTILGLWDELHDFVDATADLPKELQRAAIGMLDLIRDRTPGSRMAWIFAGQRTIGEYRTKLGGPQIWGMLGRNPVRTDFLDIHDVRTIMIRPIAGLGIDVPDETVARVQYMTQGHPEVVQELAERMLYAAEKEHRAILTPSDAYSAALDVVIRNHMTFSETWCPYLYLGANQQRLINRFTLEAHVGNDIEIQRLDVRGLETPEMQSAIRDLQDRKIMEFTDGRAKISAWILDLWIRKWISGQPDIRKGPREFAAVFIDIANLTRGNGAAVLTDMDTNKGDPTRGSWRLTTVLRKIEDYVKKIAPDEIVEKASVNYPRNSPAITELRNMRYQPLEVMKTWKATDDNVLIQRINNVLRDFPTRIQHFFIVTSDKDYVPVVEALLEAGRSVHIIGLRDSLTREDSPASFEAAGAKWREHADLEVIKLEDILDDKI